MIRTVALVGWFGDPGASSSHAANVIPAITTIVRSSARTSPGFSVCVEGAVRNFLHAAPRSRVSWRNGRERDALRIREPGRPEESPQVSLTELEE
jgi:hypothetical protein